MSLARTLRGNNGGFAPGSVAPTASIGSNGVIRPKFSPGGQAAYGRTMPVFRRLIVFIATASLACSAPPASVERIAFNSAARDSRAAQVFQGKTELTDPN